MHVASGTEHAKTQSENTYRARPVKPFGRHKETPPNLDHRKRGRIGCPAAEPTQPGCIIACRNATTIAELQNGGSLDETCNFLHVADRGIDLPSALEPKHWQSQRVIPSEKPTGTYGWPLREHERLPIIWNIERGQVCCLAAEPLNVVAS